MDIVNPPQVPKYERSNPSAQLPPFPTLIGEHPLLVSKTADGNAMVTNFRFCVCERRSFINIPLMMVGELVVIEAAKRLRIGCKDGSTYSCTFATTEDCTTCTALLKEKTGQPQSKKAQFAYTFYEAATQKKGSEKCLTKLEEEHIKLCEPVDQAFAYSFGKEVERLGFDTSRSKIWRMCNANEHFEFCPTYPKIHILPATVDDDKLKISLDFRAMKRFPSVVWRDKRTGMVLIRSSQPLSSFLGVSYFTNHADVFLIEEIVNACNKDWLGIVQEEQRRAGHALPESEANNTHGQENGLGSNSSTSSLKEDGAQGSLVCDYSGVANGHGASNGNSYFEDGGTPKKLAIVDCRSLAGVWGNSFKGGGTEDEVVYKCSIVHLDLANIHTVRDSFNKLRTLCHAYVEGTFYKNLTGCMWLTYISALLRGANIVVELMHVMRRPVLVHCSDGWDRTSQIVSLSQLMMDPYYRTLEGFQVLVEREWLHFGHKFGERGGHDPSCNDTNQISPIFLQFLDCVYQLTLQYPAEFQFNEAYLVKLLQNSQSCLFGNFLHNCQRERESCQNKTASVWSLLKPERLQFVNLLYRPSEKVLTAKISEHDIILWKSVYMAGLSPMPHVSQTDFYHEPTQTGGGEETGNSASDGILRSKSMDDLSKISVDSGRRNSDPSITQSQEMISTSPNTNSTHDDTLSAELVHLQEDSPHSIIRVNLPSRPEDSSKDFPQNVSPTTVTSIKLNPSASDTLSVNGNTSVEMPDTDEVQKECTTISLHDTPAEIDKLSPEKLCINGQHCGDAEASNEPISISDVGDAFLSEGSRAQSLDASSSAVFCQENGSTGNCIEQTMCCDRQVDGTDPKVLSEKNEISVVGHSDSSCNTRHARSCDNICSNSMNNVAAETNSSPNVTSIDSSFGYNSRQTSLLSERLALSKDVDVAQNGKTQNISYMLMNGISDHFNIEDNHHSMKCGNAYDFPATLKVQAQREISKKLIEDCGFLDSYCNGSDNIYNQFIKAGTLDTHCLNGDTSPSNSLNCQELFGVDCSKAITNSVSTDTLIGDLELSTQLYTKPLEVKTWHGKTTVSVPFSTSTALLSSSAKKNNCSSDMIEFTGSNLISRRVRTLSGASRDVSMSPCMLIGIPVGKGSSFNGNPRIVQQALPTVDRQPSIAQHIDIDGLTLFCDERQNLLSELVSEKNRKIQYLERTLNKALNFIKTSCKGLNAHQQQSQVLPSDDMATDSDGGELGSLGAVSNASDTSWETIDENDCMIVKWIPNEAVTHCAGCQGMFVRMYRNKHHCRNCGNVFCAECSNFLAPIPDQHLNKPTRVCRRCHSHLLQLSPGASSDGRIPTLVADG